METDIDMLNTMGKFIVDASIKSKIVVLIHHQCGVYASCHKFHSLNMTVKMLACRNTLYHWMLLSTIDTGDLSNHDKCPMSSHTSLVYPLLRVAAMLEDA